MNIKIYVAPETLIETNKNPIHFVEAQLSELTEDEKQSKYGAIYEKFQRVNKIENADIVVMPYDLRTCFELGLIDLMFHLIKKSVHKNKNLLLWATGDQCLHEKYHKPGIITFSEMGFRSRRSKNEFCAPWFATDPLKLYSRKGLPLRKKKGKPVVGFCGQAIVSPSRLAWQLFLNLRRSIFSWLGITPFAPPYILPGIVLRSQVLRLLKNDTQINTVFILRKSYKAGLRKKKFEREDPYHPTRLEFINNIFNSDYTVCIRGGGNWSMRLYETLSCGRIPIFVDTDCILPYDFSINWRDYVVWIEQHEIPHIAEKVIDFHESITESEFIERQKACRELWVNRLSRNGFFSHFHEHLSTNNFDDVLC